MGISVIFGAFPVRSERGSLISPMLSTFSLAKQAFITYTVIYFLKCSYLQISSHHIPVAFPFCIATRISLYDGRSCALYPFSWPSDSATHSAVTAQYSSARPSILMSVGKLSTITTFHVLCEFSKVVRAVVIHKCELGCNSSGICKRIRNCYVSCSLNTFLRSDQYNYKLIIRQ